MAKKYTEDHEWIELDGDIGTVGITDYAQEQLGDIVFIELPDVGTEVNQGDQLAVVESVKAASEIYAPVAGTVTEVNETLVDAPETVNDDAENDGWFVKIEVGDTAELDLLMSEKAYKTFVAELD
jgi:glycine cleavage system H protein